MSLVTNHSAEPNNRSGNDDRPKPLNSPMPERATTPKPSRNSTSSDSSTTAPRKPKQPSTPSVPSIPATGSEDLGDNAENGTNLKCTPTNPQSLSSPDSGQKLINRSSSTPSTGSFATGSIGSDEPIQERKYSQSHDRRFHRRFTSIKSEEQLINYYSCALISDILLQGYLYISEHHFAFFSNIFGYKTKLLIPITEVVNVTKERTIKIIPNAVGITTDEGKYVFGSLLSRDNTFRLMKNIWSDSLRDSVLSFNDNRLQIESIDSGGESPVALQKARKDAKVLIPPIIMLSEDVIGNKYVVKTGSLKRINNAPSRKIVDEVLTDSDSDSDMNLADEASPIIKPKNLKNASLQRMHMERQSYFHFYHKNIKKLGSSSGIILVIIGLLVCLFLSAVILLCRINALQNYFNGLSLYNRNSQSVTPDIFKEEVRRIETDIKKRLVQLSEIRESLSKILSDISKLPEYCSIDTQEKPFNLLKEKCVFP